LRRIDAPRDSAHLWAASLAEGELCAGASPKAKRREEKRREEKRREEKRRARHTKLYSLKIFCSWLVKINFIENGFH